MSKLPFPAAIGSALGPNRASNLSLLFDRSFALYDPNWKITQENRHENTMDGKLAFFTSFMRTFQEASREPFLCFRDRRKKALEDRQAQSVMATSTARLVIGLGLPHPTETSLLLDRLTGCPYLPGSSVKGMLREAARLVALQELATEADNRKYWAEHRARIFGPAVNEPGYPAEGEMVFYDVFPAERPTLELDVLTPHYSEYYTNGAVPGDWENPKPVRFLTIKAGTPFEFYFCGLRPDKTQRTRDEEAIKALLELALDWLGIGGKKSSGYGAFEPIGTPPSTPAAPARAARPGKEAAESQQSPKESARARDPLRHSEHSRGRPSPERKVALTPMPREAVRNPVSKETVTLESLPEGKKAWVRTADGTRIRCKGVESYPQPKVGDRLKAAVIRRDGVAVEAQFKGWT